MYRGATKKRGPWKVQVQVRTTFKICVLLKVSKKAPASTEHATVF